MKSLFFTFFILLFTNIALAKIPIEHFAKSEQYLDVVISPTGEYLAVEMKSKDDRHMIAILKTEDMSLVSHIPPYATTEPMNPVWISDDRYTFQIGEYYPGENILYPNGELVAVDANGKNMKMLVQLQSTVNNGVDTFPNKIRGYAEVLHTLPEDPKHILIQVRPWTGFTEKNRNIDVYKIRTNTAKARKIAISPSKEAFFLTSPEGEITYSVGIDLEDNNRYVTHKFNKGKWEKISDYPSDNEYKPLFSIGDGSEILIKEFHKTGTSKIYKYNVETQEKKIVFNHPVVDPHSYDVNPKNNEVLAISFEPDYPDIALINPKHPLTSWYPAIYPIFGGKRVSFTSASNDNSLIIVHVTGDTAPGQFHLFNTKTKQIRYLLNAKKWLTDEQLSPTKPIIFEARDGLKIRGYLTLPKTEQKTPPAMVVLPHGGPHARDFWEYSDDVQFLASRGYAVLQINYRGSSGYGYDFATRSELNWGSDVQYDIIDGTKWAIKNGHADKNNICIMGYSFGGYSALMAPTIEQGLFKCAIGAVGVYDQSLMWKTADIHEKRSGRNYLETEIGKDEEVMRKNSPIYQVDKLQIPVLLAHGGKDWRADEEHYHNMVKTLKERNHPHETFFVKSEGHGFSTEESRIKFYQHVEKFLQKHLSL